MQTDNLFYRIFLRNPQLISELLPEVPGGCEFEMKAPVVKEKKFAVDGLLTPVEDDPSLPLVFLEAQMQRDTQFYGRYFAEIFLYLYHYQVARPWYGLLILPNRRENLGPDIAYQLLLGSQVKRLFLDDLLLVSNLSANLSLLKLLVVDESATVPLAQQILREAGTEDDFLRQLDVVEAILANKFPELSPKEILKMLNLKTADMTQTRFYQEVIQEGRQEGRQEGEATLVLRLLTRRCGELSSGQVERVKALSIEQLENLAEALLDFRGAADLEVWCEEQNS